MALVSIITGTYNQGRYIRGTVESVINQTFTDYEHIIVDDGSTDNTQEVLAPYNSQIIYKYQKNQGNVDSRNTGLKMAKGEFIAVLDGDDIWEPTKLQKQVWIMRENPEVGLVYTGMYEIDAQGKITSPLLVRDISEDPLRHQLIGNAIPFSSMLIRREILDEKILLDPRFNLVGDRFLTLQVALQGRRLTCIPEGLVFIRTHPSSMRYSAEYRKNYLHQLLLAIEEIEHDCRCPKQYSPVIKQAYGQAYFIAAWLMIDRGGRSEQREAWKLLFKSLLYNQHLLLSVLRQLIKSYIRLFIDNQFWMRNASK